MEITDINAKNIYVAIYFSTPTNSTFYKKNNLYKNCPYKSLEKDIYNMRNGGSILLLGDVNDRNATNQALEY
jgi:hypothetical protein